MRWGQLLLCGWPGLSRLWLRGHAPSLLIAVGFSILLNLALVSTFLWPALLGEAFPALAWPVIGLVWLGSLMISVKMTPIWSEAPQMAAVAERDHFAAHHETADEITEETEKGEQTGDLSDLESADFQPADHPQSTVDNSVTVAHSTLFNQAQTEYLKGHWDQSKQLLSRQIENETRDIESRLLLATLNRRIGELDEAEQQLKQIQRFDDAIHWKFEINRESELIDREREEIESERQLNKSVKNYETTTAKINNNDLQRELPEAYEQPTEDTDTATDLDDLTETTKSWLC